MELRVLLLRIQPVHENQVKNIPHAEEQGGLSGRPLQNYLPRCLRLLKQYTGDAVTLIGVGGIDSCGVLRKTGCRRFT